MPNSCYVRRTLSCGALRLGAARTGITHASVNLVNDQSGDARLRLPADALKCPRVV